MAIGEPLPGSRVLAIEDGGKKAGGWQGQGPPPGGVNGALTNGPAPGGSPDRGGLPRNAMMMQVDGAGAHLKAPSATLSNLAEMISRFSERPVLDMTGIQGQYDFDLVFSPETVRSMRGPGGGPMPPPGGGERPSSDALAERAGSIYDSVQRYGLKLEPRKAPMEVLIVDHLEKAPTEN